jgi:shikimate 5-dehydrogenase
MSFDILINSASVDWTNEIWRNRFWPDHNKIFGGNRPQTVIDLQYRAKGNVSTPFLDLWEGSDRYDGFAMLAEQAAKAFEIWFGVYPKYNVEELRTLIYGK